MKKNLFIVVVIFLTGCMQSSPDIGEIPSARSRLANEISRKVCVQLKKEKNLYPFGSGGDMIDKIKMLHLAFKYYRQIEIEEARELLLTAGNVFINSINGDERIHDYLINYPFKHENIEIAIFISNPDGSEFAQGNLIVISMKEGVLKYKINDPQNRSLTIIHSESYEEAKKKLAEVSL